MTRKEVQLSLTLPIGMHDRARQMANAERAATRKIVYIGDIYAAAIGALTARIEAGENITFAAHPKGGVSRHSIRVDELTAAQSTRHAQLTTQSSFVATAMRHYITNKET
jgi:hypothetical protein